MHELLQPAEGVKSMYKIIGLLVLCGWVGIVDAATIYTYTGNNFTDGIGYYTADDYVTAELSLDTPLLPNQHYSDLTLLSGFALKMTAGPTELEYGQSGAEAWADVTTGSGGNIGEWDVGLRLYFSGGVGGIVTCSSPCEEVGLSDYVGYYDGVAYITSNTNNPGTWAVQTVPIPAAAWLFGSALLGLVGIGRRKEA